jgi:signal transduction histidine kinase
MLSSRLRVEKNDPFERFFLLTPSPSVLTDAQGAILRANPACEEVFGNGSSSPRPITIWDLIHPDEVDAARSSIADIITPGSPSTEMTYGALTEQKGPSLKWRMFSDPEQGILRWIAIEEAAFAEKSRFIAVDSLSDMAAGIAHEVNNPTTIIHGTAALMRRSLETEGFNSEKLQRGLERIEKSALRISRILRELRSFSGDERNVPKVRVQLEGIIEDASVLFREKADAFGISFEIDPLPNLTLRCRPNQIVQVLINLLNNAADAVENADTRWVRISHSIHKPGFISLTITDSGRGISDADQKRIMEPFFTTKDPGRGTGLGLPISRRIIEDHRGSLYFDASYPHTRFILELPL